MLTINFIAVIVAAIAAFIIGFLMHGPIAGKLWMKLANIHPTGNEKLSDMIPQMAWNLLSNLVTAFALAIVILFLANSNFASISSIHNGIAAAFIVWLGFLTTSSSIEVIWMGRSIKLWLFEVVSSFIVMMAMGIIIAAFN